MAYSIEYRKNVMEYLDRGHSQREARATFGISMTAINEWRQKYKETGEVNRKPRSRRYRKLEPNKLRAYVASHPDAYQKEIGEAFGCSATAVAKALKRLGITRKKRRSGIGNKTQ